jgi:putative PIN family toxin of toxin-antitoxin system
VFILRPRVIVDTNIVLRALGHPNSASDRILTACSRRQLLLLLSKRVLSEYHAVLTAPAVLERFPGLAPDAIGKTLLKLRYVADFHSLVRTRFRFPRDPQDEPFVELAIAGGASHIITNDADLLSLPHAHTDAAKRFRQRLPTTIILHPGDFVRAFERLFQP